MADDGRQVGSDGMYHPTSEGDLIALVKQARSEGKQLRVRGSAHSISWGVYADPITDDVNVVNRQQPADSGGNINVMLDQYAAILNVDKATGMVTAEAGIHLGLDPNDPTHTSTLENSLLYQLWKDYGLTVSELGGITHQALGGFILTGSAGGSLQYSIHDNVYALRIIDGNGDVYEVSRDDTDPSEFNAAVVSMGLLGVISTVTLKCDETFNISGQEATVLYDEALIDFLNVADGRPSLETFFTEAEYARILWWPQRGAERLVIWQAQQIKEVPGFKPVAYQQFDDYPQMTEPAISIFFTLVGNIDDLKVAVEKLQFAEAELKAGLEFFLKAKGLGKIGKALAYLVELLLDGGDKVLPFLQFLVPELKKELPSLMAALLGTFQSLDSEKPGMTKGEPQSFRDYAWSGLPMDNQASDSLLGTEFTEIWIPVNMAGTVIPIINDYFTSAPDDNEALARTGLYGWEIYCGKANNIWMSPGYTDGTDAWKGGAIRLDIYWFVANAGKPADIFFPQFWQLLRDKNIPFRLHFGKFRPDLTNGDPHGWTAWLKSQSPKWDDFLALRAQKDPGQIFVTDYWRRQLGIAAP